MSDEDLKNLKSQLSQSFIVSVKERRKLPNGLTLTDKNIDDLTFDKGIVDANNQNSEWIMGIFIATTIINSATIDIPASFIAHKTGKNQFEIGWSNADGTHDATFDRLLKNFPNEIFELSGPE